MKYKRFKIKEGQESQWRIWCGILNMRHDEAFETLREEGVIREACWIKDGYAYYGMEGQCLPATDRELNREHRRNRRECFEVPSEEVFEVPQGAEVLFDFNIVLSPITK